ncbi:LacI family DNA-binding transcriptional regulator [Hoeflea prorocentri]|uniref:LacI family DNA-binding transcriptional regulator n=1 Tax=Hoeflea prorocentri TaxID=1922333 RepID=A0A9X3UI21_9HYPH|nr:LacI family DNA-binding transcriptional regulator [Hoeflea prorocentri]MCY6381783.1 LacI family DNA-binding transcriptional regulator [Hoeflea prorocentri]MDA5399583.1 LacI family DNA-binding transcriptional regulator [Hoeflea prorocentri]
MPGSPPRRPKVKDICELSGVSRATVDRVIHNRSGVQNHTRSHVLAVIEELTGKHGAGMGRPAQETLPIDFIIPDQGNAFLADQSRYLADYAKRSDAVSITIHRPAAATEGELAAMLQELSATTRAVGIVGVDSHKIRELLRGLCRRGIPVVTLASDIRNVPKANYVGIDNHAGGRLAGYLTGRLLGIAKGKAALILGSRAYRGHEEREMGFRSVLREMFPGLRIVNELEVQENADRAREATRALLEQYDDLDAIYCIGAGQAGIAEALMEAGREKSVLFIGHGLSWDTRAYLTDGVMDVVIDEDAKSEAETAVDILVSRLKGAAVPSSPTFTINPIFRENLPPES